MISTLDQTPGLAVKSAIAVLLGQAIRHEVGNLITKMLLQLVNIIGQERAIESKRPSPRGERFFQVKLVRPSHLSLASCMNRSRAEQRQDTCALNTIYVVS